MPMDTKEVKEALSSGDYSGAYELLLTKCPGVDRRFKRLTNALDKLLEEVKVEFPDAMMYTAGGNGFALLIGESHSGQEANREVSALLSKLTVEGGDW